MSTVSHYPTDVSDALWEVLQLLLPHPSGASVDQGGSPWTSAASSMVFSTSTRSGVSPLGYTLGQPTGRGVSIPDREVRAVGPTTNTEGKE
jgi:hypothetical protein